MGEIIIDQISSKAFAFRNLTLKVLLLQDVYWIIDASLLLFLICINILVTNHPICQLVGLAVLVN